MLPERTSAGLRHAPHLALAFNPAPLFLNPDQEQLLDIWLRAVRATHAFLTEDDIQFYLPLVRDKALSGLELWVAEAEDGTSAGFIGLSHAKVHMLFIDPAWHGCGIGRTLLVHAARLKGDLTVDVNEQNDDARAFYRKCGFREVGRSSLDGTGKPFPLIHLASGT
jgi:putative acetyltransferase